MKKLILFNSLLLIFSCSWAQEYKIDISYKYLYSDQWDQAIQTYNFSRPVFAEKQPLIMNGLNTSVSYIFKNKKQIKQGLNLAYAYLPSSTVNENFNNKLNLHFANLGYIFHYEKTETCKGLYSELLVSATSSMIYRKVNGEPFVYNETKSKAFGIGSELHLKFGYYFKLKNKSYLSPFVAFAYTPFLYSPNHEAVINQTKGLTSNNWTAIISTQMGLAFHIRQQKND